MKIDCAHCGKESEKPNGAVNRARRSGLPLFCDRICAGLHRRKQKTPDQRRAEKSAYDAQRRIDCAERLKADKAAYHKRTYDPVVAAEYRKGRMAFHVEYCRRPEYREWKREYDRRYRAAKDYGEFADCFLLVMDIRAECLSQMSDYEIRYSKGTFGKTQTRRRSYEKFVSNKSQVGPVGNLELGQGWQNGGLASGLSRLSSPRNSAHDEHAAAGRSAG